MSTNETKIDAILDAINQDIAERERMADNAMNTLEKMKPSAKEYKDANLQYCANSYAACYLKHIKSAVKSKDYQSLKRLEQHIRFHSFQQHTIGNLSDGRDVSLAQASIAVILNGYVDRFFK